MIYYFDAQGRCLQSSSIVSDPDDDHHAELIKRHFIDMADLGVVHYEVCDKNYHISDIHYNGGLQLRPEMGARLEEGVLHDLPVPCVITVNTTDYACDESNVELDLHYSGVYKVKVTAWPFKDKTFEVTVP